MRWKRAMPSVCTYPNIEPMWREPLTVGGGVSIEKISARVLVRSNRYVPSASQRVDHFSSSPSRLGFSGAGILEVYEAGAGAAEAVPPSRAAVASDTGAP